MELINSICSFIVSLTFLVGLPVSIIWLIVAIVKKQNKTLPRNILIGCIATIVLGALIGGAAWSQTDEYAEYMVEQEKQKELEALAEAEKAREESEAAEKESESESESEIESEVENESETESETESESESEVESETESESESEVESETESETESEAETESESESEVVDEKTEEKEYKDSCIDLYYYDMMYSGKSYLGEKVKMRLELSEWTYFTLMDLNYGMQKYVDQYNLYTVYFKCFVQNKATSDVYAGQRVNMWFSKDYEFHPDNFKEGEMIVVYGEIVEWYERYGSVSDVSVIPRYIEFE